MRQAIGEADQESSRTAGFMFWRTGQILAERPGTAGRFRRGRTLYRLFDTLAHGQAHHRVGPHPPVAGRPAGRAVRVAGGRRRRAR